MQTLARRQGVAAECIPLGIDLSRFPLPPTRQDGPPWTILQVASLNRVKGQAVLLDALARVRESLDAHLELAGEDTLSGQLQRYARERNVSDAVTFHGFVPQDELGALLARAHVYVQSSRHEAAGVAVLEAAAAGLPIVGTRVGYVSDWDGSAALAVPPGDAFALAEAIRSVLTDGARRAALSAAARTGVRDYDSRHTVEAIGEMYDRARAARRT
jgi:glycosyltransferase involved in cell wall biosynthesis